MSGLESQAFELVRASPEIVLLRADFVDGLNASQSQISRVLRKLTGRAVLIRIGVGIYAKTCRSSLSGRVIPAASLPDLARAALHRLNVQTAPSKAERAYNEGRSQQVPTGRTVGVTKTVRRRIGYGGAYVRFERVRQR
ncbi:DUF6088 family protein [Nitrospirillum sp. BR 11163]|uniref:DUF6088 family protein n=1 Tax=Nitrospirillum sp. BR 11163 TaxID=3104323 RepID=UPI002AFE7713|nr:DUF6088 family protein [Nitrospirillum sp. BR 11163]MEA1673982.1 DUF6088 family protein [Nitrospirillum sp. BR 11163]